MPQAPSGLLDWNTWKTLPRRDDVRVARTFAIRPRHFDKSIQKLQGCFQECIHTAQPAHRLLYWTRPNEVLIWQATLAAHLHPTMWRGVGTTCIHACQRRFRTNVRLLKDRYAQS